MNAPIISAIRRVLANVYLGRDAETGDFEIEGQPAAVEIERTDEDEIRLGIVIGSDPSDEATVYLSRSEATRIVLAIAQAIGDR